VTATADIEALHAGRVLLLVQNESALDDIAAVVDGLDQERYFQQALRAAA
jgi:hypothetical protein